MALIIRDGCNESDEFPGQHWIPKVKFTYRPVLPERVYDFRSVPVPNGKAIIARNVKLLTEHLVSWEITKESGEPLPVGDVASYARVPSQVIDYMIDCVCGYGPERTAADAKN